MLEDRGSWLTITPPTPLFFVSVASKGLRSAVSLLFATLAGGSISVAAKGFKGVDRWREGSCVGWKDSEEVRRTTLRAGMAGRREESCRPNEPIITYWYNMSMSTLSVLFAWGW